MLAAVRRGVPRAMTRVRPQRGRTVSCADTPPFGAPQGLAQSVEPRVNQLLIDGKFVPSVSGKVRRGGPARGAEDTAR